MRRVAVMSAATLTMLGGAVLVAPSAHATDSWNILSFASVTWNVMQLEPVTVPPNSFISINNSANLPACAVAIINCSTTTFGAGSGIPGFPPAAGGMVSLSWEGLPDTDSDSIDYATGWTSNDPAQPGGFLLTLSDPFFSGTSGQCIITGGNWTCAAGEANGDPVLISGPPPSAAQAAVAVGASFAEVTPSGGALIPVAIASKGKSQVLEHATLTSAKGKVVGEVEQVVHRGHSEYLEVKLDTAFAAAINAGKRITVDLSVKHADGTKGPQVKSKKIVLTKLVPGPAKVTPRMIERAGGLY